MIYIYSLSDPGDAETISYIGKTSSPTSRWAVGRGVRALSKQGDAGRWVVGLHAMGLEPRMRIIEQHEDEATARERERYWIDRFFWRGEPLLNIRWGGGKGSIVSPLSPLGDAYRAKKAAARRGKHPSKKTRAKSSAAHRGKYPSAETRAKMAESARRSHATNPNMGMRGKKHSAETCMKMAMAHRNVTVETRAEISAAMRRYYGKL
jgi:hypothetical protein